MCKNDLEGAISTKNIPPPHPKNHELKLTKKSINESSSHSISNIQSCRHNENTFKDSLEGSISESRTNILIPDSLNNTKSSIGVNKNWKKSKKSSKKGFDSNKAVNISIDIIDTKEKDNEKNTKKIDYRYYSNFPFSNLDNVKKNRGTDRYWIAVYDKLIKRKNILKILNYYNVDPDNDDKKRSIKEQLLIIKDFDIYFMEDSNKPFIKYMKGNFIFAKIYLLTIEEINLVLNYINRYKLNLDKNFVDNLQTKGNYQNISKNFSYNVIYHMGNYMNVSIYGFTNYNVITQKTQLSYTLLNQKFPNSKKIAKLVKLLMINFPKYSFDFFVCYLLSKIRFINFSEKTKEIKNIIYSQKNSYVPLKNKNNRFHNSSSYSPGSDFDVDEDSSREKPDIQTFTYQNYNQSLSNNLFKYNTIDNNIYKIKEKDISIKKKIFRKHMESVYANGFIDSNESKKNKTSIKQFINNINKKDDKQNIANHKNNGKDKNNIKKTSSIKNNIKFPNFLHIKKDNKKKENGKKEGKIMNKTENKYKNSCRIHLINQLNIKEEEIVEDVHKNITNYKIEPLKEDTNKENTGIFVVNKKIDFDLNDIDEDSIIGKNNNNNINEKDSEFLTPEKKNKHKYYS